MGSKITSSGVLNIDYFKYLPPQKVSREFGNFISEIERKFFKRIWGILQAKSPNSPEKISIRINDGLEALHHIIKNKFDAFLASLDNGKYGSIKNYLKNPGNKELFLESLKDAFKKYLLIENKLSALLTEKFNTEGIRHYKDFAVEVTNKTLAMIKKQGRTDVRNIIGAALAEIEVLTGDPMFRDLKIKFINAVEDFVTAKISAEKEFALAVERLTEKPGLRGMKRLNAKMLRQEAKSLEVFKPDMRPRARAAAVKQRKTMRRATVPGKAGVKIRMERLSKGLRAIRK